MSSRKRQQLKLRKERTKEIKEALEAQRLDRQLIDVMTHTKAEIRSWKVKVRLRLPDQANLIIIGPAIKGKTEYYRAIPLCKN
ncbi:MAG: hypothetical protein KA536_15725 [Saprospiraceae bacterium]|nr:hypothetical protein [Saprospiraceae bacterium]